MLLDQLKWKTVTTFEFFPTDFEDLNLPRVKDKLHEFISNDKTDGIEEREEVDNIIQITRYWVSEEAANEWVSYVNSIYTDGRFLIANVFEVV